jgi:methionyl-tRNA synthetase
VLNVGFAANKLIEERQPFKLIATDPAAAATAIHTAVRILEGLAILLSPFVPRFANGLWAQLGLAGFPTSRRWAGRGEPTRPHRPEDRRARQAPGLARRGRHDREGDRRAPRPGRRRRLAARPEAAKGRAAKAREARGAKAEKKPDAKRPEAPAAEAGPKPPITIEQFQALDLRMAKVVAAKPVPKADKLLELTLELANGERRTVLSGIKAFYAPEALVGRQVVYLANLAPRVMRGIESQGMILAANDVGNAAVLLQAERPGPRRREDLLDGPGAGRGRPRTTPSAGRTTGPGAASTSTSATGPRA